jgi:HK97 family phage portal protein
MSLRAWVRSFLLQEPPPERRAANPALAIPAYQGGQPVWNSWRTERAIRDGYRAHDVVYACVRRLSLDAASVPWLMVRDGAQGLEEAPDHRGTRLIARPNPRFSWQDMIELLTLDLHLGGNAYWLHLQAGQADELWRLRPDRIQIVPDSEQFIRQFDYKVGEKTYHLSPEAVVHFRFFDPGDDFYGMAPLRAASRTVDTDNEALDWNKASLQNRAVPAGALVSKPDLTKQQIEDLRRLLRERAEGPANARRTLVLWGELAWQQFGLSPQEMDFIESLRWSARRICSVFGVQAEVTGLVEVTYENKRSARRQMWEDTIIPFLADQRSALNLQLAPRLGDDACFDYDLSNTPAVVEARKERAEEAKAYFSFGISPRAINEHLALGFDPEDCPEQGFIPATLLPVGYAPPGDSDRARRRAINLQTEEQRAAHWRSFERQRQAWERGIREKVAEQFRTEAEDIVAAARAGERNLDSNVDYHRRDWMTLLTATWRAVIEHFGGQVADQLGGRGRRAFRATDTWDPWKGNVQAFVSRVVGDHVVGITETTKLALREAVRAGVEANEGTDEIAARVREVYADADRRRSYVIARTEVGGAANYGSQEAARQSGVVTGKEWISSRDDRVRDSHQAIDGEKQPLEQRFSNGLMQPGDPDGDPGEVISCRCVSGFTVGGEEE